jgi:copper homeostasis protein
MLIEVAAFSLNSALNAYCGGAGRIELCSGYAEGGLTPSAGTILLAKEKIPVPIHVMIRPRGGDFIYGEHDIEAMVKDIEFCKNHHVDGVVFGILNAMGHVDKTRCKELVDCAGSMNVTFHRAFDVCADPLRAIEDIIECGFHRILTSGQKINALKGAENIALYNTLSKDRIIIMPGAGINKGNATIIAEKIKCSEMHLSGKQLVSSTGKEIQTEVAFTSCENISDKAWYECDASTISEVLNELQKSGVE